MHLGLSVFVPGEDCEGNASGPVCLRSRGRSARVMHLGLSVFAPGGGVRG